MQKVFLVFLVLFVSSCSPTDIAKTLLGGGPNLAANGQIGGTNNQTIGATEITQPKVTVRSGSDSSPTVNQDNSETKNFKNEWWLIVAFALALMLDSPTRWPGQIWRALTGK